MRLKFDAKDEENMIFDWNYCVAADQPERYIFTKEELLTCYDIDDFGYSKATNTFWCDGQDDDSVKRFKELLDGSLSYNLFAMSNYFVVNELSRLGAVTSMKHWDDRCSPINLNKLADKDFWPEEADPEMVAKKTTLYQSILNILNHDDRDI